MNNRSNRPRAEQLRGEQPSTVKPKTATTESERIQGAGPSLADIQNQLAAMQRTMYDMQDDNRQSFERLEARLADVEDMQRYSARAEQYGLSFRLHDHQRQRIVNHNGPTKDTELFPAFSQ